MTGKFTAYLIWSNQHALWWGPDRIDYTAIISQAGRFTREQAEVICVNANVAQQDDEEPNEVMVLAPEAISTEDV